MSLYSKRRGGRSLAAIVAAMLVASVLAVVAGSPVQAANTSFEVKVDHDNNAATATEREFAGHDRYDTALRLAKNFAMSKGGRGSVPIAFVASGDTLVDSISVAGLAGSLSAPILLTKTGSLHGGVADFIEDYGVDTVYVLGGAAAVSDDAIDEIKGLVNEPKADRIAGADRYGTAAAIAAKIDSNGSWCGTDAASAVLINGASDMLAYGVAVQTMAYRLGLPVLMTGADMLPDATVDYITDNDIEHVQIIGGTMAVSAGVASALTSHGVDSVVRTGGDSASAVSVELAKLAGKDCAVTLGLVSSDRVALVRGNPDGVSSAPVLASSLTGGYMVPPLIVDDMLPASVSDYLAATPEKVGANNLNLGIVAIGGTAAVSEATMMAALDAAASSGVLTVAIGAATNTNGDGVINADDPVRPQALDTSSAPPTPQFMLYFNDDVEPDLDKLQDIVEVNGVPAVVSAAAQGVNAGNTCDNTRILVTLGQALNAGDTISIASSSHTLGRAEDKRLVPTASATVTAVAPDRSRPTARVLGIADASPTAQSAFTVTFSDAGGFAAGAQGIDPSDFTFARASGSDDRTISSAPDVTVADGGAKSFTATVTISGPLVAGDRLIVKPNVVSDAAGNKNSGSTSGSSAIKAQASPRATTVLMSELKHSAQAGWAVPAALVGGAVGDHVVNISAKGSGDAAGAAGNTWSMIFDRASTYDAAKPLDIDVRVDTKGERVTVRFNNGPATATLGDLMAALRANADFDSRFSVGFANCASGLATTPLGLLEVRDQVVAADGAGRTQGAIEVTFNAYLQTVNHDELLIDVLADAARRAKTTNDATGIRADAVGGDGTAAGGGLSLVTPTAFTGPGQKVRYEFETALTKNLPESRDLVNIAAGHAGATAIEGPPAYSAITAVTAVATGYAADAPTSGATDTARDRVDEDKNGPSQPRIAVSTSVKARN
ncbi:MAG: cell wall-binding repeat-containing protein [Acidimicrobiaceae bacterium]|nr:cell wall-binding repeat-containing protein [Acidimicrobiaceae bacterium]